MQDDRLEILNQVKAGEISIEEGARRLSALEEPAPTQPEPQPEPVLHEMNPADLSEANLAYFRRWWLIPLWVGLGVVVFSAGLMSWGFSNAMFWYYCAWLPFLLGLVILLGAAWSRTARWLHVRVHESNAAESHNIRISFPIPIGLAGWALRMVGPRITEMKNREWIEAAIPMLQTIHESKEPMVVEVNEKDGEKVQVYIV